MNHSGKFSFGSLIFELIGSKFTMAWAIEWEGEISSQQNNTPQMHVVSKDGRKMSSVFEYKESRRPLE